MSDAITVRRRPKIRDNESGPRSGSLEQEFRVGRGKVYDQWWAAHGSADLRKVFEHFHIDVFRRSSCLDGFAAFLELNGFRGKHCVEIGTSKGLTAIVLSRLFEHVTTIDIQPDPERKEITEFLGIKNITHVDIRANIEKTKLIEKLEFDAAYSDGDHDRDTVTDFRLVESCGRVLFHEYWPLQPAVWELVNSLDGEIVTHGTYALWRRNG